MPHLSNKKPSTIFRGSIVLKLLCIARYTLRPNGFIPREFEVLLRISS